MAPRIGARLVAEKGIDHVAVSGLTVERLIDTLFCETGIHEPKRDDTEIEGAMATVALRYVVPSDPGSIAVDKIIKFRNEYQEERGQYQTEVVKITKEL